MKQLIACVLVTCFIGLGASAQITNTKWKGTLNIPSPAECVMDFKKDTVYLNIAADNSLIETMLFTVKGDTLTLVKVSGMSPCSGDSKGLYRLEFKDDKLYIKPLSDDCQDRLDAFTPDAWIRQKD